MDLGDMIQQGNGKNLNAWKWVGKGDFTYWGKKENDTEAWVKAAWQQGRCQEKGSESHIWVPQQPCTYLIGWFAVQLVWPITSISFQHNYYLGCTMATKNLEICSDWCGSVGWASSGKLKSHWFDSWSGHMPGLLTRSPAGGVQEAADRCFPPTLMFLSFSFSLPSPLSKNK